MQSLFYHNRTGKKAYTTNLDTKAVRNAITLHPLKRSEYMYRLHSHFMELQIQHQTYDIVTLQRNLDVLNQIDRKGILSLFTSCVSCIIGWLSLRTMRTCLSLMGVKIHPSVLI